MADGNPPPLSPHEEGENHNTKPLSSSFLKSKHISLCSTKTPVLEIQSPVQSILVGSQKILLNQDYPKDVSANRPSAIGLNLSHFTASSTSFPFNYQETPKVVFQKSDKAKLLAGMKHVLIAKFSHGRPSVLMMKNFLSNRKLIGSSHVSIFDAKHIFIEFEKFEDFVKFWIRQNGIIHGFPVRFFKWDELFDPNKESSIVPIWIHLPQLPLYLFEEGALLLIASALGKPLHLDGNHLNRNKISYATICIEFDILRAPPREVWIQFGESLSAGKHSGLNVGFSQKIVYGFMPLFCSRCCHIGHLSSVCKRFKTMVDVREAMAVCTIVATEGLKNGDGKELLGVLSSLVECTSESEEVAKLEEGALLTDSTRVLQRSAAENMGEGDSEHVAGGHQVDAFADDVGRAAVPVIVESAVIAATEASAHNESAAEPTAVAASGSVGEDTAARECIEDLSPTSRQYSAGTAGELAAVGHNAAAASGKSASWEPAVSAGAVGSVGELVAGTVSDESSDVLGLCNGAKHVAMTAAEQLPTRNRFVVLNEIVPIEDLTLEEGEITDIGGAVWKGHADVVGEYDTGQIPQQLEEAQGISVELNYISSAVENIVSRKKSADTPSTAAETVKADYGAHVMQVEILEQLHQAGVFDVGADGPVGGESAVQKSAVLEQETIEPAVPESANSAEEVSWAVVVAPVTEGFASVDGEQAPEAKDDAVAKGAAGAVEEDASGQFMQQLEEVQGCHLSCSSDKLAVSVLVEGLLPSDSVQIADQVGTAGSVLEAAAGGKMDVLSPEAESILIRKCRISHKSSISPRKLSSTAAEFKPKWEVLVKELVEEKKQTHTVMVDRSHKKKKASAGTIVADRVQKVIAKAQAVLAEKKAQAQGDHTTLNNNAMEQLQERMNRLRGIEVPADQRLAASTRVSSPLLSDEMKDIICPFKCKSVPNSPPRSKKQSKSFFDSQVYSPATHGNLKRYGSDTSDDTSVDFDCSWQDYDC